MTVPTTSSDWCAPPKASPSPLDEQAASTIIFPPQGSGGVLTVELHSVTRMGAPSNPTEIDQWPVYAVLECEGFQICARAAWWGGRRGKALWRETFHFDVSSSPGLLVSLSARNRSAPEGCQVEPRGHFKITAQPDGSFPAGKMLVDVQDGAGQAELTVTYSQQQVPSVEDPSAWKLHEGGCMGFPRVTKRDTGRTYAMAQVQIHPDSVDGLGLSVSHPFIAPLKFALTSTVGAGLTLLSPLASGSHLFHQIQKERCFDSDKARFYAAELVLVLEYHHSRHIILALLGPEDVILDACGHISLCNPIVYSDGLPISSAEDYGVPGSPEYAAPELLCRHEATQAVGWWMLGVLLYEMVAGRPPFYHKDAEEQQRRIIHQPLQFPPGLPSATTDILAALLNKDHSQRLGANGAAEVKKHAFFHGVAWRQLRQRKVVSPFQPDSDTSHISRLEPVEYDTPKQRARRLSRGTLYELRNDFEGFGCPPFWQAMGHEISEDERKSLGFTSSPHPNDDDWELIWDSRSGLLSFTHRLRGGDHTVENPSLAESTKSGTAADGLPSTEQVKDALAAALKAGYSSRVVSQVIKYGADLNIAVLHFDHIPADTGIIFHLKDDEIPVTPLEWAVEHDRADLVTLFLESGADPDYTCYEIEGPALVRAVRRHAPELVQLLVPKSNRISCTRALCTAIDQQDLVTVNILLTSGARCEFEEADVPGPPRYPMNYDNEFSTGPHLRPLKAGDLLAPLVRAVRLGNTDLVRLLLAHGADVNVGYHCDSDTGLLPPVTRRQRGWDNDDDRGVAAAPRKVNFACGRAVQLARELGHDEIVRLLVDGGADVRLPRPAWAVQGHTCPLVPRAVWLDVTVGLEELKGAAEKEVA